MADEEAVPEQAGEATESPENAPEASPEAEQPEDVQIQSEPEVAEPAPEIAEQALEIVEQVPEIVEQAPEVTEEVVEVATQGEEVQKEQEVEKGQGEVVEVVEVPSVATQDFAAPPEETSTIAEELFEVSVIDDSTVGGMEDEEEEEEEEEGEGSEYDEESGGGEGEEGEKIKKVKATTLEGKPEPQEVEEFKRVPEDLAAQLAAKHPDLEQDEEGEEESEEEARGVKFDKPDLTDEGKEKEDQKQKYKRRASLMRRQSIGYRAIHRHGETDEGRISGDFTALLPMGEPQQLDSRSSFESFMFSEEGGSIQDEVEEEEKIEPIDREYFYELHKTVTVEYNTNKRKNNLLHKKMAEYFKKRKMEHVLKETDQQVDTQQKYLRKLDALGELKHVDNLQRTAIMCELDELRQDRNDHRNGLRDRFTEMQDREREVGTGLIYGKTGKEIPEKHIAYLLKRQRAKWSEVGELRLSYIKIRNRVNEKQAALRALDRIGNNLHLIDYEQLKVENQSHTDKIEERDEELTRLRLKCSGAIQCLAHIREKSAAAQLDQEDLVERLREVEIESIECREQVNYYKQQRDYYRLQAVKLRENSGLLIKPKLLHDMEDGLADVKEKRVELTTLKQENETLKSSIKNIKQHIEETPKEVQTDKSMLQKRSTQRIYRGRPTLTIPTLP